MDTFRWRRLACLEVILLAGVTSAGDGGTLRAAAPAGDGAWSLAGVAALDEAVKTPDGLPALRLGAKATAEWIIADADRRGRIDIVIRDEGVKPEDPKTRRVGPRWGVFAGDGRVFAMGVLYAPYLGSGDDIVAAAPPAGQPWHGKMQYIGQKRAPGKWVKWSFVVDDEGLLSVQRDGKAVARFNDADLRAFGGMRGVRVWGDDGSSVEQPIWLARAEADLGAPVARPEVKVVQLTPDEDPIEATAPVFKPELAGQHPRLLITPDQREAFRARRETPSGTAAWTQLEGYLGGSRAAIPGDSRWFANDEHAQREGFWKAGTLAVHHLVTEDAATAAAARQRLEALLARPHWQEGKEQNIGMGAANILLGAALLYDSFHDTLDPALRDKARERIFQQTRILYHEGFLRKRGESRSHYWQGDPANNHRWHRLGGLMFGALATYEPDDARTHWMLARALEELAYVMQWLPSDGSYHDSASYMVFGAPYLLLAATAADQCAGTKHLDHPWFRGNASFRLHSLGPRLRGAFNFGDGGGYGFFNNYFYALTSHHRQADEQDGIARFEEVTGKRAFAYGWMTYCWRDPAMDHGDVNRMPTFGYFPDLGAAYFRDAWTGDGARAAMAFKCGPLGGYALNRFRNQNNFKYINVAHDHPDANSFQIAVGDEWIATDDLYPKPRNARAHNVILVDGKGHTREWNSYSQPWSAGGKQIDMSRGAVMKGVAAPADASAVAAVEGEAAGSYTGLDRFRRTVTWVPNGYALVLDDLRAPKAVAYTWLWHAKEVVADGEGAWRVGKASPRRVMLAAERAPVRSDILDEMEENLKSAPAPRGHRLEVVTAEAAENRFIALVDLWDRGARLDADAFGEDGASFTVTLGDTAERWTWRYAPDADTPSGLTRQVGDQATPILGPEHRVDPRADLLEAPAK